MKLGTEANSFIFNPSKIPTGTVRTIISVDDEASWCEVPIKSPLQDVMSPTNLPIWLRFILRQAKCFLCWDNGGDL